MLSALRASLSLKPLRSFNCVQAQRSLHLLAASTRTRAAQPITRLLLQRQSQVQWNSSSTIQRFSFISKKPKELSNSSRFFSSNSSPSHPLPVLSPPSVAIWLLSSATLVFAIVVVGGVTRLTESGLSITEWKPITGILPPLTSAQWEEEFGKYKLTPEFKLLNHSMDISEFKSIFFMEWGHRVLGRILGLAFVFPTVYFIARKKLTHGMPIKLTGMALLIGAQGAMGWYMVKSGLEDSLMDTPGAVPRVSQYRLAAHLALAFILYMGMFSTGMNALKDWKFAHGRGSEVLARKETWNNPIVRRFLRQSQLLTGLVFLTALSGAFVAGLDAGLLYNEFPLMAGRIAPPSDELFSPAYAKATDKSDLWWRNILENPTTVQFDHRVLAITTYFATAALYANTFRPAIRAALPPLARTSVAVAFAMANIQVALGISTLLFLVPIPLAASHQAGSVALLSAMLHILISMRRPGSVARAWREINGTRVAARPAGKVKSAGSSGVGGNGTGGAAAASIRDATSKAAQT